MQDRASGRDHESVASRGAALDRVRDQAQIKQCAGKWRKMEEEHPEWSHAFSRHVDISGQKLAERAADWKAREGYTHDVPDDATKWRSAEAMVVAADGLKHSDTYKRRLAFAEKNKEDRFTVSRPLSEVLGPGWRADVYGRTTASGGAQESQWNDNSIVVVRWRRQSDGQWHPLTCFPQPGK